MPGEFDIAAFPLGGWALELRGSRQVEFNGELLQSCMNEMVSCGMRNGCLAVGRVRLTEQCGDTLFRHAGASD